LILQETKVFLIDFAQDDVILHFSTKKYICRSMKYFCFVFVGNN
jgi:hypothetical protein